MLASTNIVDECISGIERLTKYLRKSDTKQVGSREERSGVKATSLAWFHKQRPGISHELTSLNLGQVDDAFRELLDFSDKYTTRERYLTHLKSLRLALINLRGDIIIVSAGKNGTVENPPDFSKIVADPRMRKILNRRWEETKSCMRAGAHLAATVMMGALLEALLLARINSLNDKSQLFKLKCIPIDKKTGKAMPLQQWTLQDYIDSSYEMGWIAKSAKDVGNVLRDYRNFVHPAKELSEGVDLTQSDTQMFWAVFRELSYQVIESV